MSPYFFSSPILFRFARALVAPLAALALVYLGACVGPRPAPGIGGAVAWQQLPGWGDDRHAEAWPALQQNCASGRAREPAWAPICRAAEDLPAPDDAAARAFFETWFEPHRIHAADGGASGLITGYFEPVLHGSRTRDARFRYPIRTRPADLVVVDLASLYPELRGKTVRGRLVDNRVLPYPARAEIDAEREPDSEAVLLWVDDPYALFFLHIQGSGRVVLPDGETVAVGYADQNGHPYVALGKCLVDRGLMPAEAVTLPALHAWLESHPASARELMNCNPSYIFFTERELPPGVGPIGSMQAPLTPMRSVAVDQNFIALATPLWLATDYPQTRTPLRRLVFAQDTGGAIRGPVRADLFCGSGPEAELLAGTLKQSGELYALLPRTRRARR